jgi:hypothetical protein
MPAVAHHTSAKVSPRENQAGSSSPAATRTTIGSGRSAAGVAATELDVVAVIVFGDRAAQPRTFGGA